MNMPSFDELVRIAQKDPAKYEELRNQLVNDLINDAPESTQRRLRGLQFQVDMERRRAKTPMASCIAISKMMHDSLYTLGQTLNSATGQEVDMDFMANSTSDEKARVLSFPLQANS